MAETIDPVVENAIQQYLVKHTETQHLFEYFANGRPFQNQRTACIVAKQMLQIKPFAPPRNEELWLAFMKFMVRTAYHTTYPSLLHGVSHVVKALVSKSLMLYRNENLSPNVWWTACKSHAVLCLNAADLEKLFAVPKTDDWINYEVEVMRVHASCDAGMIIAEEAFQKISRRKVSTALQEVMDVFGASTISAATMTGSRQAFIDKMAALGRKDRKSVV